MKELNTCILTQNRGVLGVLSKAMKLGREDLASVTLKLLEKLVTKNEISNELLGELIGIRGNRIF